MDWDFISSETKGSSFGVFIYEALVRMTRLTGYSISSDVLNLFVPRGFSRFKHSLLSSRIYSKEQPYAAYFLKPFSMPGFKNKMGYFKDILFPPAAFIQERYGLKYPWQILLARIFRHFLLLGYAFRALFLIALRKNHVSSH